MRRAIVATRAELKLLRQSWLLRGVPARELPSMGISPSPSTSMMARRDLGSDMASIGDTRDLR
jgi:hypothetical protein